MARSPTASATCMPRPQRANLAEWASTPEGALALVLLLDQFSRNLFRGSPQAFAQDASALSRLRATRSMPGFDQAVRAGTSRFFFLPFMHSEEIADQERCVALCHALRSRQPSLRAASMSGSSGASAGFRTATQLLGRHMSAAEQDFMDGGGFAG